MATTNDGTEFPVFTYFFQNQWLVPAGCIPGQDYHVAHILLFLKLVLLVFGPFGSCVQLNKAEGNLKKTYYPIFDNRNICNFIIS